MTLLFNVTTTINEFRGCKDVCIQWFMVDRDVPVGPYAELIEDYEHLDTEEKGWGLRQYAEDCVNELFTAEEADALLAYLDQHHPTDSTHYLSSAKLPIERGVVGVGALAVGGPTDFLMLSERDSWNLAFEVWGYYDLRQHEPAAGGELERSRAFRSGTLFASSNGIVRASDLTEEEYQKRVMDSGLDEVDETFTRQ